MTKIRTPHEGEKLMISPWKGDNHLVLTAIDRDYDIASICVDPDSLGAALAAETDGVWIPAGELPEVEVRTSEAGWRHLLADGRVIDAEDDPAGLWRDAMGLLVLARHRKAELAQQEADAAAERERDEAMVDALARTGYETSTRDLGLRWDHATDSVRRKWLSVARAQKAALDAAKGVAS